MSRFGFLSSFETRHSSLRPSSIDGEIKDVKVPRIAGGPGGVFGFERFGENKWHHLFVTPAVRTQAAFQRFQIMMFGGAPENHIAPGEYHQFAQTVGWEFQFARGSVAIIDLGDPGK